MKTHIKITLLILIIISLIGCKEIKEQKITTIKETNPIPNLQIVSITGNHEYPAGSYYAYFNLIVNNTGSVNANIDDKKFFITIKIKPSNDIVGGLRYGGEHYIRARRSESYALTTIQSPAFLQTPGIYTLTFTVDPENMTNESNKEDNSKDFNITVI